MSVEDAMSLKEGIAVTARKVRSPRLALGRQTHETARPEELAFCGRRGRRAFSPDGPPAQNSVATACRAGSLIDVIPAKEFSRVRTNLIPGRPFR